MTKQELEKAIENGESVWYPKGRVIKQIDLKTTKPIFNGYQIDIMIEDENGWHTEFYGIKDLYKTKAEAEHYLNHANVTRTETLPFATWEEFLNYEEVRFFDKYGTYRLHRSETEIILQNTNNIGIMWALDLTEENFYKAYDECVRLFRSEE